MIVVIPLLVLLAGGLVLLGVFGPAAEQIPARAFWKKQIAMGPLAFLGAACLLPLSFALVGRDFGVFYILPAIGYSVVLFLASAIGIFATRGRRILVWVAALAAAVLPILSILSRPLHSP